MPALDWEAFGNLPGARDENFEQLCRILIRRSYAQYGTFRSLVQQPGVEFHLKLETPCSLGEPGRWYGWQCRWYDLASARTIGSTRRNHIQDAITKTQQILPDLTDWVLWTKHKLAKADQEWFYSLSVANVSLALWCEDEIEEFLSGEASIYRRTYFGDLTLTPDELSILHDRSTARIKDRWQTDLHQEFDIERAVRKKLGQTDAWEDLQRMSAWLVDAVSEVTTDLCVTPANLSNHVVELIDFAKFVQIAIDEAADSLERGDLDHLAENLAIRPTMPTAALTSLPRQLRSKRNPAVVSVTNLLAAVHAVSPLLNSLASDLGERQVAVVAEFGYGKTFLAAELSAPEDGRPAGILLHGADLGADDNLDDLAKEVVIQGNAVSTMELLVAAIDSAGRRAHRRLPIFIDGLNEAEDPRRWKRLLAGLDATLTLYPYVLVVSTLRPQFTKESLPPSVNQQELSGFGTDTMEAVGKYFQHYRIDASDAELPLYLFEHPIFLRMFCEVTNPDRDKTVGVEAIPASLAALFDSYLNNAAERIAELSPRTHRYYSQDVRSAFHEIGMAFWRENARSLPLANLRDRLGDAQRPWDQSLLRALEQHNVLIRTREDVPTGNAVAGFFDALAGHLVADALLATYGRLGFKDWLRNPEIQTALTGDAADRHPLALDIVRAFVGLMPRRFYGQQIWTVLEEPMRTTALLETADLEGRYLDSDTVDALATFAAQLPSRRRDMPARGRDIFDRLWRTRGAPAHPLNAEFLERVLRPLPVAERDLRWSEWVRRNGPEIMTDLQELENRWRDSSTRSRDDHLLAGWVKWLLTSTVLGVRDFATEALYWYGLGGPQALFDTTIDALSINDPYVSERLLAASYGVAMAHQIPSPEFAVALGRYLQDLADALMDPSAKHPTYHQLARLYVRGTLAFGLAFCPDAVPERLRTVAKPMFAPGPDVEALDRQDPRSIEVQRTLRMDFENYTLGSLFDHRRNYDMEHPGHMSAVAHVLGTVRGFGWREESLGLADQQILDPPRFLPVPTAERYGKKYSWVGFYTYAGKNSDRSAYDPSERLSDLQLDPSFPTKPRKAELQMPPWTGSPPGDQRGWIRRGRIDVPVDIFNPARIGSNAGPWVAVHGDLTQKDKTNSRLAFANVFAVLVDSDQENRLMEVLEGSNTNDLWRLGKVPTDYRTFGGEIPWSPQFAKDDDMEPDASVYRKILPVDGQTNIELEMLTHRYAWESNRSPAISLTDALVPSKSFSEAFNLKAMANSFDQVTNKGTLASITLDPPCGFEGQLLYLREDLLLEYANGRNLIWVVYRERQIYPHPFPEPDWYRHARQQRADCWSIVRKHSNVA